MKLQWTFCSKWKTSISMIKLQTWNFLVSPKHRNLNVQLHLIWKAIILPNLPSITDLSRPIARKNIMIHYRNVKWKEILIYKLSNLFLIKINHLTLTPTLILKRKIAQTRNTMLRRNRYSRQKPRVRKKNFLTFR